jgi:hypothetical protein
LAVKPVKFRFRSIPWMPVLATALCLEHSYVPGGSPWPLAGTTLWLIWAIWWFRRTTSIDLQEIYHGNEKVFRSIVLSLLAAATISPMFEVPVRLGFWSSKQDFAKIVLLHNGESPSESDKFRTTQEGVAPKLQLGIYPIYNYLVGKHGDFYFITAFEDITWNTVALSGFAYRPDPDNSFSGLRSNVVTLAPVTWAQMTTKTDWYSFRVEIRRSGQLLHRATLKH